jgi:predicted transcriptional regulator
MSIARMAKQAELQEALQRLGARRVEATLLSSLVEQGSLGTKDIVEQTGLRQPEVSVGMQLLRERHWVEAEAIPRAGKGRPMHKYRLVADAETIRRHYENEGKRAIDAFNQAMTVLRRKLN